MCRQRWRVDCIFDITCPYAKAFKPFEELVIQLVSLVYPITVAVASA
jgi:hypothetical protein